MRALFVEPKQLHIKMMILNLVNEKKSEVKDLNITNYDGEKRFNFS